MGKIYQFPGHKRINTYKPAAYSEKQNEMESLMYVLIETYKQRIKEVKGYAKEIQDLNGKSIKSPKELIKEVRSINKLFYKYGISSNFYRFVTLKDTQVLYFNDRQLIYVFKEGREKDAKEYTVGEFISEFEPYKFNLMLDEAICKIFDRQVAELETTIKVLENTQF